MAKKKTAQEVAHDLMMTAAPEGADPAQIASLARAVGEAAAAGPPSHEAVRHVTARHAKDAMRVIDLEAPIEVDVEVPASTAYTQWTHFEEFPEFMQGVVRVDVLDDSRSHWVTSVAGETEEFEARITERVPGKRLVWESAEGEERHVGIVTFQAIDEDRTRVKLHLEQDVDRAVGDGVIYTHVHALNDLERFKSYIESRYGPKRRLWRRRAPR